LFSSRVERVVGRVSEEERETLRRLHAEGKGRNEIARQLGRSAGTVTNIASELGLSFDRSATKKASEARAAYAEERRLELIGKGFDKADDMLAAIADAGEFQKWSVALGTLVDKARLETGQATNRSETVDPTRRERIKGTLDELAAKRREHLGR
jgi:phosphoglycolate phosphatase-like HAD superfamily hydrolase